MTRLNGTSLPRDRYGWEEQHPELNWDTDKDTTLPGYWDEVPTKHLTRLFTLPTFSDIEHCCILHMQ